jgi:hypothetical protein
MKIVQKDCQVINVEECSNRFYYGVEILYSLYLKKSFITFDSGSFKILSIQDLTGAYSYRPIKTNMLTTFLSSLLDEGAKVYQFETFKELSDWLNS